MLVLLMLLFMPLKAGTIFSCTRSNQVVPAAATVLRDMTDEKKLVVIPPLNISSLRRERIKRHIKVVVNIETQERPTKKRLRKRT